MFNLGARLGKYTGNQTYLDWAEKAYDWTQAIGLLGDDNVVWDGTDADHNCSVINQIPWTYNQGLFLYGSAVMYNVVCVLIFSLTPARTNLNPDWRPEVEAADHRSFHCHAENVFPQRCHDRGWLYGHKHMQQ